MSIRLDVGNGDSDDGDGHVDLCVIRYGDDGVLQVSPDFSNGKRPYRIEVKHKSKKLQEM
jgi:hypothetical protein